jgi:hypothetical protein
MKDCSLPMLDDKNVLTRRSPVAVDRPPALAGGSARRRRSPRRRLPSALGRFVFGPEVLRERALDEERMVDAIVEMGGTVAPAHVIRIFGVDRVRAEALLCRAVARQGGSVDEVDGAVIYRLPPAPAPTTLAPVWRRRLVGPPVTGNRAAVDATLTLLIFTVLVVSALVLGGAQEWWTAALLPLAASTVALVLPLARVLGRAAEQRQIARENGHRRLVRAVVERPAGAALSAHWLSHAWVEAAGHAIKPAALTAEMRALGGEPDVDADAHLLFRFPDLDHEARALAALRRLGA